MGFYLTLPQAQNKAAQLRSLHGATNTTAAFPPPEGKVLVCAVQNGPFDAAAVVYNEGELWALNDPTDNRPKDWLHMDRDKVIALCPYVEQMV